MFDGGVLVDSLPLINKDSYQVDGCVLITLLAIG